MLGPLRIIIEIPALDRLVSYLEAVQQAQINSLSEQVAALTSQLQQHRTALEGQMQKEN